MTLEPDDLGAATDRQARIEEGRASRYASAITGLLCDGVFDEADARCWRAFVLTSG